MICKIRILAVILACLVCLPGIVFSQIKVEQVYDSVPAKLVDHGDFYLHPNGDRIEFLRKQDVYSILKQSSSANAKSISMEARIQSAYGDRVEFLNTKRDPFSQLLRIKTQAKSKFASPVSPAAIKALDSNILRVDPVLANARGQGDIVITNKIIIKLATVDSNIQTVLQRFNLDLVRQIIGPKLMFSVSSIDSLDTAQQFNLVRNIANDPNVAWAQPQFRSRAFKTSTFEPNDPLFGEQWHLRNTGKGGSRCDTDCDANNAWGIDNGAAAVSGAGTVIAIIDDGVQLNHEDLSLWQNSGEIGLDGLNADKRTNGLDDDGNGFVDDWRGWDFVDDDSSQAGSCGEDDTRGQDNDPNPQDFTACVTPNGDDVEQDDHGTAVAGLAAAIGDNATGVVGTAYSAEILPIRLISAFDANSNSDFCVRAVEAMSYAGTYADVINNSWGMDEGTCPALDVVIGDIVDGTLADLNGTVVPRRDGVGTPVVFASGNRASGWLKVTAAVTEGEHAFEWRFLRSAFPDSYDPGPSYSFTEDNSAWLDNIIWPDGSSEGFESGLGGFNSGLALNSCDAICTEFDLPGRPSWSVETDLDHVYEGLQSALINASGSDCGNVYLHSLKEGPAGEISFWVWVSTNTENGSDKFEFLIDGKEVLSFGDLPSFVDNDVSYPANLPKAIAVGASDSGDLSSMTSADLSAEERISYSQYGSSLDVLAPSSNQHLAIVTTDRYGPDGEGYNSDRDIGGSTNSAADPRYTDDFGGTSASAPIVAGIAATLVAANNSITAASIESVLRDTADKIGRHGAAAYDQDGNTRSDYYGYGRVNMFRALKNVLGESDSDTTACNPESNSYSRITDLMLSAYQPLSGQFCSARGALPQSEESCFPIRSVNGKVALICL